MSDNLTIQNINGIERIAYAMRSDQPRTWWQGMQRDNGKGSVILMEPATFAPDATMEEIRAAAGMLNDAIAVTPSYMLPGNPAPMIAADVRLIVDSVTGAVLGTHSDGYKVHTYAAIFETFQNLMQNSHGGGWKMLSLGKLRGGRVIVAQAERDEAAEVIPGDYVSHRLMLQTSFDGTLPTGACDSEVRFECDNTRAMIWADGKAKRATQRHRSNLNGGHLIMKAGINTGSEAWAEGIQTLRRLADVSCNEGQARDLLRALFAKDKDKANKAAPAPAPENGASDFAALLNKPATLSIGPTSREREPRAVQDVIELFCGYNGRMQRGGDREGVKGTRYGLLQAITENVDWHTGRTWDTGRTSALFGVGAQTKAQAFELLTADLPAVTSAA